jgi:hypothetical protein
MFVIICDVLDSLEFLRRRAASPRSNLAQNPANVAALVLRKHAVIARTDH